MPGPYGARDLADWTVHSKLAQELEALKHSVAVLDADTRRQFDRVYEAILGLMATSPRKQ